MMKGRGCGRHGSSPASSLTDYKLVSRLRISEYTIQKYKNTYTHWSITNDHTILNQQQSFSQQKKTTHIIVLCRFSAVISWQLCQNTSDFQLFIFMSVNSCEKSSATLIAPQTCVATRPTRTHNVIFHSPQFCSFWIYYFCDSTFIFISYFKGYLLRARVRGKRRTRRTLIRKDYMSS